MSGVEHDALAKAKALSTPGDVLLGIFHDPTMSQLRQDAIDDPYIHADYPGHNTDLPARRERFLDELHRALATHPNAPPELQSALARCGFGAAVAANPTAAPEVLDALARGAFGWQPLLSAASLAAHPATPTGALDVLAFEGTASELVLAHPAASPVAREAALFLLGRGDASEATLLQIATRRKSRGLLEVARHPATPSGVLEALVRAQPLTFSDLIEALATHPNATATVLQALARVLASRYGHPYPPYLEEGPGPHDSNQRNVLAVLAHPACDDTVLAPLAHILPLVELSVLERRHLAADPRTEPATLTLLGYDVDLPTLRALAANPATPAAVLERLAPTGRRQPQAGRWHELGAALAANPAAPPEVLRRVYAYDGLHLYYAKALLANPNTPPDVRTELEQRAGGRSR
jgi:hypothetical protein